MSQRIVLSSMMGETELFEDVIEVRLNLNTGNFTIIDDLKRKTIRHMKDMRITGENNLTIFGPFEQTQAEDPVQALLNSPKKTLKLV